MRPAMGTHSPLEFGSSTVWAVHRATTLRGPSASSTQMAHRELSARYWAQADFSRRITRTVFFPTSPQKLAPLATAHVCVAATRNRATACDDAIEVQLHATEPPHVTMRSPFMVLLTTSTFERFTRSERPESVARTPIRSPLAR
jgi:hypothetical protein